MKTTDLRSLVRTILEARIRETDITDGTRVPFGSPEHVTDLEMRISDLERWRDRQRRGSEARANYARLIGALKRELRAAYRANEPKTLQPIEPELTEADKPKDKKRRVKCKGCGKTAYVSKKGTDSSEPYHCAKCDDEQIFKDNKKISEAHTPGGDETWVVFDQYEAWTIGRPYHGRVEAQQTADARNRVARLGAWGKQNPGKDPPYVVITSEEAELLTKSDDQREEEYWSKFWSDPNSPKTERTPFMKEADEDDDETPCEFCNGTLRYHGSNCPEGDREPVEESVSMEDPEYSSIEDFVQFLLDDDRTEYTHEELAALNFRTRMPIAAIRKELESYGLKLAHRAVEKQVRGFTSNSHDRWFGKGSMPTHGGAGIDPQTGRATTGRGDI